uniref:Neural proliferation differentiation and control protein 1 n=1 Tax=Mesocestoides corti TaxID=53468 RepID=A0A5K3FI86_MESCO
MDKVEVSNSDFMNQWETAYIACGSILAIVIIIVIASLLTCFVMRKKSKKTTAVPEGNRRPVYGGWHQADAYPTSSGYVAQPQYVQPSGDHKLAPSAEILHYKYQKEHANNQVTPSAPPMPQLPNGEDFVYEVPGLASQQTEKEVLNPLYDH